VKEGSENEKAVVLSAMVSAGDGSEVISAIEQTLGRGVSESKMYESHLLCHG